MWAVIEIQKKQYKVKKGDMLVVERLNSEGEVTFEKVLALYTAKPEKATFGTPYISGASVKAKVIKEAKAPKIIVYKVKRRKKYRKKSGHRQIQTFLKISDIVKPK